MLVKGGDDLIQQSLQSSQLNLLFVLKENIKGRTVPNIDLSNLMEILANDQSSSTISKSVFIIKQHLQIQIWICSIGTKFMFYAATPTTLKGILLI